MIVEGDKKVYKILFIYLKEEFGLYKYSDEINSACVRGYLNKNGVKSQQFIEDNLVNIIDSVDDIMVEECENIVFFIDVKNVRISKLLSREIKDNYEDTKIIWFGDIANYENHLQDKYVDTIILENADKALLQLAKEIDFSEITGIAYIENGEVISTKTLGSQEEIVSPYKEGLLDSSKLNVLQVKGLNKDYILKELEEVSEIAKGRMIEIVSKDLLKIDGIEDIVKKADGVNLATTVNIESLTKDKLKLLKQANFRVVTIVIDKEESIEKLDLLVKEKSILFNFQILTENGQFNKEILQMLKDINPGEVIVVDMSNGNYSYFDIKAEESLYKRAMLNGINASITGFYPDNIIGNCSKHITIGKKTITSKDYESLKDFLSLNSAIIHRNNNTEGYIENIAESEKGGCYLPHYHKINSNNQVEIDNSNIVSKLNFVNYSKVNEADAEDLQDSYLRIETNEDVESFINDIKLFKETGVIKGYAAKNKIENECRWASNEICKLKTLTRFSVQEGGDIAPCSGCSTIIGNIKDGYSANVRKVYKHMDKIHLSRECSNCEVHNSCSKCSMLMDQVGCVTYCNIRRSNPEIAEYFVKKNILNYLIRSTNTFKNTDCESIKFSTNYTTHLYPRERKAIGEGLVQPYISLIFQGDDPILIDLTAGMLNKISKELAFVIEGLIKGFDIDTIKDEFVSIINCGSFDKDEIVDSCINFLRKSNYMKAVM